MIISEALHSAREKLRDISESPTLDAEILLAEILEVSREFLFARPNFLLSPEQIRKFGIVLQQRMSGFSVATILGKKSFFGRDFVIDESVLVPRPETELLLEKALDILREKDSGNIVDVGTGSGILSISLALELPTNFSITAIDRSKAALNIAQQNAKHFQVDISFVHTDFADFDFPDRPLFLVVNLPYVPESEQHFSTLREPTEAIFSGKEGLDAYRNFFHRLQNIPFDAVFFEFHPPQKDFFAALFTEKFPECSAKFFSDLSGKWRIGVLENPHF